LPVDGEAAARWDIKATFDGEFAITAEETIAED
jgi:hypothetical protein